MQICRNYSQPNFKAMRPNQFKGIDYAVVRKFKAPVEKFNNHNDLEMWADCLYKLMQNTDVSSIKPAVGMDRREILGKWKEYLKSVSEKISKTKKLLIFSSLLKELKKNNEILPPLFKLEVLETSLEQVENKLAKNKEILFDFNKIYRKNLEQHLLKDMPKTITGWVKLPSKKQDSKNYADNVERLKLLSAKKWCTQKKLHAESYLNNGEFHIYLEEGKPKLGIRFSGCEIQEVQGEKNNTLIPPEHLDILREYIKNGEYYTNDELDYIMYLSG